MSNIVNEPLNLELDLTNLDTSFPVLKAGLKDLRVASIVREENRDKNGFNAVVTLETTEPDFSETDKPMNIGSPGTKLKQFLALQPKAGTDDPDGWKKRIAQFQDAVLGTNQGTRPGNFRSDDYIGKIVRCVVEVVTGQTGQRQNNIKSMSYPT